MRRALLLTLAIAFAIACGDDITEPTTAGTTATGTTAIGAKPLFATTTTEDGLSISTDKDDYQPGDVVHFTGYGWQAGDVLDIVLTDEPATAEPHTWSVEVGVDGMFHDSTYVVDEGDLNVSFTLVATSRATGRSLTVQFTDGNVQAATIQMRDAACTAAKTVFLAGETACAFLTLDIGGNGTTDFWVQWISPDGTRTTDKKTHPSLGGGQHPGETNSDTHIVSQPGAWNVVLCANDPGSGACSAGQTRATATFTVAAINFTSFMFFPGGAPTGGTAATRTGCSGVAGTSVTAGTPICAVAAFSISGSNGSPASIRWRNPSGVVVAVNARTPFAGGTTGAQSFAAAFTPSVIGTWTTLLCESSSTNLAGAEANGCAAGTERGTATFTVTAANVATTTTVTSSKNPSGSTEPVTFTAAVKSGSPAIAVTTGQVTFKEGGSSCADAAATQLQAATNVDGTTGVVTFTTNALSIGSHTIWACYGGATGFLASEDHVDQQVINTVTVTEIASSVTPSSVTGQSVTFTATVRKDGSPIGANGSVSFRQGSTDCTDGTQVKVPTALNGSGQATYTASFLASGSPFSIRACYGGASGFDASNAALSQIVNRANTTTLVGSSNASTVYSEPVTFSVTVSASSPGSGTPSGNVTLRNGDCTNGTSLGTAALNGSGQASFSNITTVPVGTNTISGCFGQTWDFNASSGTVSQVVGQAATTTTITSNHNPSVFSQEVTFTATVAKVSPATATPSGNVSFELGGTACGAGTTPLSGPVPLDGTGKGTFSTSTLDAGTPIIRACYDGSALSFHASDASLTQTVGQAKTATTITSDHNPAVFSQLVTFTATVASVSPATATPTGTLTFEDGGTTCGSGTTLDTKTLSSGQATFSTSNLTVATHTIRACYAGTTNFEASNKSVNQVITKAETTTDLTSSANPSVFSEHIDLKITVQVVSPGTTQPDGQVTLKDGPCSTVGMLAGPTAVDATGKVTFNVSSLSVGVHHLSACYLGTGSFEASTGTLDQEVIRASTTTQLTSSANSSVFSQPVDLKATVQVVAPGTLRPTGDVTLNEGTCSTGDPLGDPVTLDSYGKATFNLSTLSVGTHTLSACYAGNVSFVGSYATLVQTVNKAGTTTTLTSSANPSVFSQPVPLSVTVHVDVPGTQTPDGAVTLNEGDCDTGTPIGLPATLNGSGDASFNVSSLSVGPHSLSACYPGNGNFKDSYGTLEQNVNKASTTTTMLSTANPAVYSQPVGVHVEVKVVAPAVAKPVGDVTVKEGSCDMGTALAGPTAIDVYGKASFDLPTLSVGAHGLTACYGGNGSFATSYAYMTQTVNKAATTTTLTSSPNPSILAQTVAFYVTVAKVSPATATPQGEVTLKEGSCGGGALGAPTALNPSGQATFNVSSLTIGSHDVFACYAGNTSFESSVNAVPLSQEVHYNFVGFSAPVDRPNTMNVSKAGQAIPLKWRLTDYLNRPITDLTGVTVKSVAMSCENGGALDPIEEYSTASTSGLLNLGDGNYQYNWKTATNLAGTCKSISLVFGTGGLGYTEGPRAFFSFKR